MCLIHAPSQTEILYHQNLISNIHQAIWQGDKSLPFILIGDFNYSNIDGDQFINTPSDPVQEQFLNFFLENGLYQFVDSSKRKKQPTWSYIVNWTKWCIRHHHSFKSWIHQSCYDWILHLQVDIFNNNKSSCICDFFRAIYNAVNTNFNEENWSQIVNSTMPLEESWKKFWEVLKYAVNTYIPFKSTNRTKKRDKLLFNDMVCSLWRSNGKTGIV